MSVLKARYSLLIGATTNWLAFAAALAVSFFLTPHLIGALGKARYDVWCVVESILAYLTLLDMGVAVCVVRYVARHAATSNRDGVNRITSSCLVLFVAAGAVAVLVGVPVLLAIAPRLSAKLGGADDVLPFMLVMLINLAVTLPLSLFPSILDGLERFSAKSLVRIIGLTIRTAGVVIVLRNDGGLLPLALVYTAGNLLEHGLMILLCFRFMRGLRLARRFVDRATLREVRTYSVNAFLAMLAGRITLQTGAIVIGLMLPAGQVTFFVTAARLVDYAKTLLRQITTTLTPGISAMEARGDTDGIRWLFLTATRWLLLVVLPVHAGLLFFGAPFLARWVGDEFIAGSYPSLVILSFTLTLGVLQSAAARVLYGLGRLRLFARLALADAAVNVILLFALIQALGVTGVAVAVALPNMAFCVVVIAHAAQILGVSWRDYGRECLPGMVLIMVPATVWSLMGEPLADWWPIMSQVAIGLLAYALAVCLFFWRRKIVAQTFKNLAMATETLDSLPTRTTTPIR